MLLFIFVNCILSSNIGIKENQLAYCIISISEHLGSVAVVVDWQLHLLSEWHFILFTVSFPLSGLPEWGRLGLALRPARKSAEERLRS